MKAIILLAIVALASCRLHSHTLNQESLEEIKKNASFEVYDWESHPFRGQTVEQLRAKLGLKGMPVEELQRLPTGGESDLPENFVSQDKWPDCVHQIRDQQSCGSCWAFAASEVLSDRLCIASQGKTDVILSPQDLVSCDKNDYGCGGGYLDISWDYIVANGVVSDECYPYSSGSGDTGSCQISSGKCQADGQSFHKYFATSYKQNFGSIEEVKEEIYNNGPVETGFLVYYDFMSYKSGIYRQTSSYLMGGHAVKIVGWGVENGVNYWVVANSWGAAWGEAGHFRIEMNNCCNFEAQIITGYADTARVPLF
jgi:cathepsin B